MIDWVSCIFPVDVPVFGGKCIHITPDGEMEFETHKFLQVEGSFSARVSVRSIPDTNNFKVLKTMDKATAKSIYGYRLYITGNPTKFLQGHNVWGINDYHGIMIEFMTQLVHKLGFDRDLQKRIIALTVAGDYQLTRLDLTESFVLDSIGDVRAWIRAAAVVGTGRNQGVSSYQERTLYLGKNSRRMTIKAYAKGDEIRVHRLPAFLEFCREKMQEYADKLLRVEVTLRRMTLKDLGMGEGRDISEGKIMKVYAEKLEKLQLPENKEVDAEALLSMPVHLHGVYALWLAGHNVKQHYSKSQYYANRKELLKYGIDIKAVPAGKKSVVVPLLRVIRAEPATIPEWAYEQGVVFYPFRKVV